MKKLQLNLDELEIESFVTTPNNDPNSKGTVYGHNTGGICNSLDDLPCNPTENHPNCPTGGNTCGPSCDSCYGQTCLNTCGHTCDDTTCGGITCYPAFCPSNYNPICE